MAVKPVAALNASSLCYLVFSHTSLNILLKGMIRHLFLVTLDLFTFLGAGIKNVLRFCTPGQLLDFGISSDIEFARFAQEQAFVGV
ncbi:hypothetical protein IRY61_03370 [Candidatus Saccharibacteria bacterium]|nr:hypothetical protein [Candidatus Saccharibacteria bacterium]